MVRFAGEARRNERELQLDEQQHREGSGPGDSIASEVTDHVRSIVSAAEEVADSLKREAERRADIRVREADAEASRRLSQARAEADQVVNERRDRIADLSDAILERTESVLARLDQAEPVRRQLDGLLAELAASAQLLARESPPSGPSNPGASAGEAARSPRGATPGEAPSPPAEASGQDPPVTPTSYRPRTAALNGGRAVKDRRVEHDRPPRTATPGRSGGQRDHFGGARQVAMQMAVAGSTRAEVAAHLQRTFELPDPHPILNDVFGEAGARL